MEAGYFEKEYALPTINQLVQMCIRDRRWTNKFSEVGIETVGDLVGKSEEDLLRIDGIRCV